MTRLAYGIATLFIIALGLVVRRVPMGLPWFAVKYGGSILWGMMVLFLVRILIPRAKPWIAALAAGMIAVLVETSRLVHIPDLDAFRLTLAGTLLLGRIFSVWNIGAYLIGIGLALGLDLWFFSVPMRRNHA